MVKKSKKVIWSHEAIEQLSQIHSYIKKQSPSGAKKVISDIFSQTGKLAYTQQGCRADELKQKNDGTYRVLFVYHYRISFRITIDQIHILRIRHISQEPFIEA